MEIELVDGEGSVLETVETHNIEVSDDLGFNVDHLAGSGDDLPDKTAEIRIKVPDDS